MVKATYQDVERLANKLTRCVKEFRRDFDETEVNLAVVAETMTTRGTEKITIRLKDIPPLAVTLPGFEEDDGGGAPALMRRSN